MEAAGGATGTAVTDRRRAARRVREIAGKLRSRGELGREESTQAIRRVTGELAVLTEKTAPQAAAALRNGRPGSAPWPPGSRPGRPRPGTTPACVAGQVPPLTASGTAIINGSTIEMTPPRKSIHED
jgi:hypothetical protein